MSQDATIPRVAIIGGGITGLAAAHRLVELARERQRQIDVRLFEASARLGGTIRTERIDDFIVESGPDSFLSEKPAALRLCERLGMTDRLIGTREEFRRTYVVRSGKLHPLPEGFLLLAPTRFWPLVTTSLFSWPGKLRMSLDLVLPRGGEQPDESLASFVTRRLGREALDRVAQPLVGGIYTADPDKLSLAATMPRFLEMERQHRSLIYTMWKQSRGMRSAPAGSGARWSLFVSVDEGMQTLVEQLARALPEGVLHTSCPVHSIRRGLGGGWRVEDGQEYAAVIVATPAHRAASLVADLSGDLASELRGIPYASSATVTLAFRREEIPHPLDGFGFVVPAIERRSLIACTFSNIKYPKRAPAEFVLLRSFVGGALQPNLFEKDDHQMVALVRHELAELLGVQAKPTLSRVSRYQDAMPQYHLGHAERIRRIEGLAAASPGLHLAGSAYRGVGIPDCVRGGEEAAEAVVRDLAPSTEEQPALDGRSVVGS
jgi:oxygen-dependent protoporphyrinogen oxidase